MLLVGASGNHQELPGIAKGNHPFKASNDPFFQKEKSTLWGEIPIKA